jgi:serine/threonine protein kinase
MNDNQGTARMDAGHTAAGTARMDGNKSGTVTASGVVFASGQTIVLNGKNCVIDSMISMGSGEAVVYKVIIDGKPYALKLYKQSTPLSDTAKKVITKIKDNPRDRIVKIYDFGRYNEQDFEVMEYAEGGTLDQYLKSNGAIKDTTKIKNIVKMITEGLEQLHREYKVIYQDLKPENIYFRDANKTSIILADFGISSIMAGYDEEVEVTASITDLYAAPELAHKGNRNEVMVTPAVDYFALGITMFELWLGQKPFKSVKATSRDYLIAEEKVDFPIDMPDDYATIIRGLIRPQRKDRWGNEHVRKWLKGEAPAVESIASQKADTAYDPLKFSNTESATSPRELAALMDKYPDIGKTCLYEGIIKDWLKKAGDLMLFNEIQKITSQYAQDKDAGLYTAILALDPERPFKSRSGKICKTAEEIADAIMAESAYYMEDLKKPNANLYLYLATTEGSQGKEAADTFCKYFKEYTPKRALALVYLKLQSDGGITIGLKHYQSPDELKHEKDGAQIALIKKAVTEKDSMLLVWLSDIYGDNLKSTDTFSSLSILEQFFLLGLLPFLSFKEFNSSSSSWDALRYFIDSCPGRGDLFEIYAAQGLPLTGQNYDKKTPIDYVLCNFYKLSKKHDKDTIYNLIHILHKLGADVNEYSDDGTCPLINAYRANNDDLVKLILELGADEDQYRVYKDRREEEKRIEQERRAEEKRKEQERRKERERIEQERERQKQEQREKEEAEYKRREEQLQQWRELGRCPLCGGKLSFFTYYGSDGRDPPWGTRNSRKCKACHMPQENDHDRARRIRAIFLASEVISAVLGALMLNMFTLLPFAILFFIHRYRHWGLKKFIRVTSIIVQIIISTTMIISNFFSLTITLGSIILLAACFIAYWCPLLERDYYTLSMRHQ